MARVGTFYIGDNASTDDLRGVVDAYPDDRITYQRWERHVGANENFNRIIANADAPWVLPIGIDDRLDPDALARMSDAVQAAEGAVGMVVAPCRRVGPDGAAVDAVPLARALLAALDAHSAVRRVSDRERRLVRRGAAMTYVNRAVRHRLHPGALGRRGAAADLVQAWRLSPSAFASTWAVACGIGSLLAPSAALKWTGATLSRRQS